MKTNQLIQRFTDLYDLAPTGYVSFERSGRIAEANLTIAQLLGMPRERMIGMPFMVFVLRDDLPLFLNHLLRCRCSDMHVESEIRLKNTKREVIYAGLTSKAVAGSAQNGAMLYQTSVVDLTARVAAESKLQEKEAELAAIVTQTPFMLTRCTRDLRYRYVSRAYAQMLGRKPAEIASRPIIEVIGREGFEAILPHIKKVLNGDRVEYEMEVPFKKGGARWLHCVYTPDCDFNGRVTGWFASLLDITERKLTEHRLAEQARLLDLSNDAILIRDRYDRITYWNHGARELYGYSSEEALGKVSHELLDTVHPEGLRNVQKKLQRDKRWIGELTHTCKNGSKVVVISRWSLDRGAKGGPASVLETNTEITDRKRAEERTALNLAVTKILSESPALTDAVSKILNIICETLDWQVGAFWIPESDGSALRCLKLCDSAANRFTRFKAASMKLRLGLGVGLPGRVWKDLRTAWVRDISKDRNFPRAAVAAKEGLHATFAFPVFFGKRFFGVMEFFSPEIREPDEDLLNMFAAIGSQIGQFVQRKQAEAALQRSKKLLEKRVRERTRELHKANKVLEAEIDRRKGLEGEILSVSDREQQRLGQELHDGLCQHLTAVAFMARSVALRLTQHRVVDSSDIDKIAQLVNDAAVNTRELSRALHRLDVDAAGLTGALQDLVDREIWRIPCRLEITPAFHMDDDTAAGHLYRIAREAVINANKHAQAREIVVKLQRSEQGIHLQITDDGVGISKDAESKRGLGFHIMSYRAQLISGRLEIYSPKHGGTCVSCSLPNHTPRSAKPGRNGHPPKLTTAQNGADRSFRHLRRQRVTNG